MAFAQTSDHQKQPFSYAEDPWIPAQTPADMRIRLIALQPAKRASSDGESKSEDSSIPDELCFRLFWTPLDSPKVFKALSYTWGLGQATKQIQVNGRSLLITQSLEIALRHLRHETEVITLWVDQICIDQQNDKEKTEQVGRMSSIYRACEEVLIWLGPAADNSDAFMDAWRAIGEDAEKLNLMSYYTKEKLYTLLRALTRVDPNDPFTMEVTALIRRSMALITLPVLEAMTAWFVRPWWNRVWVMQELCLANIAVFVCGSKRVTAEQALLAAQIFKSGLEYFTWPSSQEERHRVKACLNVPDPTPSFFSLRQRRKSRDAGTGAGDSLYEILHKVYVDGRMRAKHPCDTIYGILGLANDVDKLDIRPDYSSKESINLLYARVAKAIIKTGELDLLALAQHPKLEDDVPSWVPDWTCPLVRSFAYQAPSEDFVLFAASKGTPQELIDTPDICTLGLRGFKVDEVEEVAGIWEGAQDFTKGAQPEAYLTYLLQIRLLCLLSAQKGKDIYPSLQRREEALWRIPVGDLEDNGVDTLRATQASAEVYKNVLDNMEFFEQYKAYTKEEWEVANRKWVEPVPSASSTRYRGSTTVLKNKRPFMSKDGYVVLGPRYMRRGDLIVVFCGATIPYIVRPLDEGSRSFRFVGECYCDGIMDGEIVDKRPKEDFFLV